MKIEKEERYNNHVTYKNCEKKSVREWWNTWTVKNSEFLILLHLVIQLVNLKYLLKLFASWVSNNYINFDYLLPSNGSTDQRVKCTYSTSTGNKGSRANNRSNNSSFWSDNNSYNKASKVDNISSFLDNSREFDRDSLSRSFSESFKITFKFTPERPHSKIFHSSVNLDCDCSLRLKRIPLPYESF